MVRHIAFTITFFMASQAFACGVMEKADPRVGSTVAAPNSVTLYFSEAFDPKQSTIAISNGNAVVQTHNLTASAGNTVLFAALAKKLPPGKYKVAWEALWVDCGRKTQGDYKFTVQ